MKNLKKIILSVIFICIMYSFSTNFPKVSASELENEIETEEDMARESLENLEKNLSENNTSVVEELNKLINDYEEMYDTETSYEEKEKIENIISSLQKYIEEYNQFSCERQQMKESDLDTVVVPFDPKRQYKAIVIAAIATFKLMKCPLSTELLIHAKQNKEIDSVYSPTKGGIILQSTLVQEKANDINIACDSERFINNGDSISKDLFYAIRRFQYEKIYKDECSIVFHIRDRYDFEGENKDLEGILKIAVGTMYECQQAGVIKPFIIDIAETMPGCVPYTYEFRNQEAIITGAPNYVNNIAIPEKMMDVSTYLNESESSLYNVTTIDDYAFYEADNLKNITIPNTVTSIGQSAFENCSNLATITLPNALTTMGDSIFKGCTSLESIALPNTVTSIGQSAFENCSNLATITLPNALTTMGDSIFKGCTSLESIALPNIVTSIGQSAFENCSSLTTITLPFVGGEENNEKNNFLGYIFGASICSENGTYVSSSLKEIILTGGTSIGISAFQDCNNIENIRLPNTVTNIGQSAFENCSNLATITLPNELTTIENSIFKGCTSLNNITLPNTVITIGQSAFENCSSLTNINLSNQLIEIGSAAFKACINLKNITIPSSVEQINNYAFSNCTKLKNVIILKETSEITNLHQDVFLGCSALQSIIVPMNRVAEYKNKDHWSNYATKINPSSTQFDVCYIDCLSNLTTSTILEPGYNKLYQIQVECGKSYTITSSGSFIAQVSLYDANMKVMSDSSSMMNNNCGKIVGYLSPGIYYLSISFKDNTSSGEINTQYVATWANTGWKVIYNKTNEISNHLHKIADNQYKTQLYYINGKGAGFYEFTLTGTKQDGTEIFYPEGAIKIYNDEERTSLIEKYNLTTHNNQASSKEGQNKIIAYLPQDGYYYINICLDTNQIETLQFNIQAVETKKINLFDLSETTNESIPIFENNNIKVDNIKKVTIQQSGKFTIEFVYDGIQTEDILCILSKQNYNSANYEYTIETKIIETINNENQIREITLTLDAGTYYIGYFNKNDTKTMTTHLTRIITQYGSHALVPDPDDQTPYGSQIAIAEQAIYLYNRSYRGTNILEGFTRLIYLDDDYAPSVSRLDYDFYTSNESIATVSAYGTVQALNVTKDTNIKIMAVYKKDKSIVFTKTFTIVNDRKTYASDPIDITINMTIKDGMFTSIKFKNVVVPDQMLQHYFWTSKDTTKVTVDNYGRLYANSQAIGQTIEVEGAYMYNERVKIKIKVTVID